jgi:hypothetical protein
VNSVRHPIRDAIIHKPMSCHRSQILKPTGGDQDSKVPRAVLSAFMTGVCRTVVMNLENRGIGKPDLQTSANFVKGWTHQQP